MLKPSHPPPPPPQRSVVSSLKWRNRCRSVFLGCFAVVSLLAAASPAGAVAGYGDVPAGTYYTDAVQWSVDNGITGNDDICFVPDAAVSRAETAVWLHNMEGRPDPGDAHGFDDITDTAHNDAVSWLANTGITTGVSETMFAPDDTLTRAQAAVFLYRLEGEPSGAPAHNFTDVPEGWRTAGVSWLANTGITTGVSETRFAPDDTLTRAQLITFLYRYNNTPPVEINPDSPTPPKPLRTTTTDQSKARNGSAAAYCTATTAPPISPTTTTDQSKSRFTSETAKTTATTAPPTSLTTRTDQSLARFTTETAKTTATTAPPESITARTEQSLARITTETVSSTAWSSTTRTARSDTTGSRQRKQSPYGSRRGKAPRSEHHERPCRVSRDGAGALSRHASRAGPRSARP